MALAKIDFINLATSLQCVNMLINRPHKSTENVHNLKTITETVLWIKLTYNSRRPVYHNNKRDKEVERKSTCGRISSVTIKMSLHENGITQLCTIDIQICGHWRFVFLLPLIDA